MTLEPNVLLPPELTLGEAVGRTKGTPLSAYIWELKDQNKNFSLKWKIIDRAPPYNSITKKCRLCMKESYYIIFKPNMATLNKH